MLQATPAIVLYYTKYNDSSVILHLFTQLHGRISVMVYGLKGKRNNKLAAFQALYLLDIIIEFKPNRNLQVLKEFKLNPPLHNVATSVVKSAMALFIAEVLHKCLREENSDQQLFAFVSTSIKVLNELEKGVGVFHLAFLVKLSRYLGFAPHTSEINFAFYDIKLSKPLQSKPSHNLYLSILAFKQLQLLLNMAYHDMATIQLTINDRNSLLDSIMQMYEVHAISFKTLKSHAILQDVFNN